jgi:hypothetical protein
MTRCEHKVDGVACGKEAVCVVLAKQGRLDPSHDQTMGRGVGSLYLPVCELHKRDYPGRYWFEL